MAGAAAYRAHRADCVVGIGGGAALDVAKVVGVHRDARRRGARVRVRPSAGARDRRERAVLRRPADDLGHRQRGRPQRRHQRRPDTHVKRIVFSPHILAQAVFADPELTLGLPPAVTAATGMDALTHNVESYLSPAYHPLCDGIALEGTRIAARALATAVREPAQPRRPQRHDDGFDDGRDRVPEGPRARSTRARTRSARCATCTTASPTR